MGGAELNYIKIANSLSKNYNVFFFLKKILNLLVLLMIKKNNFLKKNYFNKFFFIKKKISELNPKVVFTSLSISSLCVIIKLTSFKKFKLIVRIATQISAQYNRINYFNFYRKLKYRLFIKILGFSDKIIVQSSDMEKDFTKYINKKKYYKLVKIYNPVATKELIETNKIYDKLKIESSDYYKILYFGRLEKVKNIYLILKFFKQLMVSNKSVRLILLGEGSEKKNIVDFIKNNNLNNKVELLESVKKPFDIIKN